MDSPTETHCSLTKLVYATPEGGRGRRIEADFSGGVLTSNGGALLLGLADRATGLLRRLAGCFEDFRDPRYTRHGVESMVGQRVLGLALGYEVSGAGFARARPAVDRLHAHQTHQPTHAVPSGHHAPAPQMRRHLAAAVERIIQVQLVHPPHQRQVLRALADRLVVPRRPAHAEQLTLPRQRQFPGIVNHRHARRPAQRPNPLRKKSRSIVNSPIFACSSRIVAS